LQQLLELRQIVSDFRAVPVHGTNELPADYAVAVDDVGFRPAKGTVGVGSFSGIVADGYEIHPEILEKLVISGIVLIDADAEHGDPVLLQLRLHLDQRGRFFDTGRAPRSPEIQDDHLAPKLAERNGVVGILDGEIGGILADAGWAGAAVASNQSRQQSNDKNRGSSSHPAIIAEILMDAAVPTTPEVSIIVPARNEEVCLGDCLRSLVSQAGVAFEIIVVDDQSTDRTRSIAQGFTGVRVISPGALPTDWTGKNNAVAAGARVAQGKWLLFTDADTVHLPGSLARAIAEAKEHRADLLSYSPEQIAVTFWELATMPVVFAELARQYPPEKVSDPESPIAAANGQYILVRREAYEAVGGHAAVANCLLEDVALVEVFKTSGRRIRFRYAADAVRTRMYRNFRQLREGWTKNLVLLFPRPGWLATKMLAAWGLAWVALVSLWIVRPGTFWVWKAVAAQAPLFLMFRLRKANFTSDMEILGSMFGYPMFAYLLLRSKSAHKRGGVTWKGRTYQGEASKGNENPGDPGIATSMASDSPHVSGF
jgi:hypothetical protein